MKKAFTLIEVNLAMLIMAGGILSIVGLYAFGFRENTQSREDVASAALADAVMSPLIMALSATNVTWTTFRSLGNYPSDDGWGAYLNSSSYQVTTDPDNMAKSVYDKVISAANASSMPPSPWSSGAVSSSGLSCGLVVMHEPDSAVVKIGFRATQKKGLLLSQPLYYTEVRFQGVQQ